MKDAMSRLTEMLPLFVVDTFMCLIFNFRRIPFELRFTVIRYTDLVHDSPCRSNWPSIGFVWGPFSSLAVRSGELIDIDQTRILPVQSFPAELIVKIPGQETR